MTDDEGRAFPHDVQLVLSSGKKIGLQLSGSEENFQDIAQMINQILDIEAQVQPSLSKQG